MKEIAEENCWDDFPHFSVPLNKGAIITTSNRDDRISFCHKQDWFSASEM